jgi:hypothetical protein
MHVENIVIGQELVSLDILLGSEQYPEYDWFSVTVRDSERYLPRLLANHGFTSSANEIRRNRKDLDIRLDKPNCLNITLGKGKKMKKIYIVVGE